tara:strand:+ start:106 stop:4887 length:4782 start_codon:yes stop_codon:yes gene_type:complete
MALERHAAVQAEAGLGPASDPSAPQMEKGGPAAPNAAEAAIRGGASVADAPAPISEPERMAAVPDPGDGHGGDGHDGGDDHGGHGHGGHGHGGGEGATFRQLAIVLALTGGMIGLHWLAVASEDGRFDPTAMLALGFVILASFTIGSLVDVIKLPHITGYLLAGMIFGPSIAGFIPVELWPPFDEGVLSTSVIELLSPLTTLAVALIALTAGGELKLDSLRKGLRAILGVLFAQLVTVLVIITLFFYAVSGVWPAIALPGLGDLSSAVWPIGLTVAAISFATSPAATIAVINETGAKGSMSRTVLSAVVLKDVVVVVLFGVFSAWAAQELGTAGEESLGLKLFKEIFGSIGMGIAVGVLIAVYLRFVGKELLLFIVGVVYVTTLVSVELHLDGVLIFLTAGFLVSNFSKTGGTLIHEVERLSTPVYVVFFTVAGAKLHLDEVIHLGAFALALVAARIFAIWIGVKFGAMIGNAEPTTRKYGWMGFLSQAGVAITFASFLANPDRFPEEVHALSGLLIAGVALNEVLGPVALKIALGLAGEIGSGKVEEAAEEVGPAGPRPSQIEPWPEHVAPVDWGTPPATGSVPLDRQLDSLEEDLRAMVREVSDGAMHDFRKDAETYLRELRREYLRHHRRILVEARGLKQLVDAENTEGADEARQKLALMLHDQQAELAERWRASVLSRAAQLRSRTLWSPQRIVESLDDVVAGVPETMRVPYHPRSFESHTGDGLLKASARTGLRIRRRTARLFGRPMAKHELPLRDLVRYHMAGLTPMRLEGVAALVVDAERHLAGRTRQLFDAIVQAYDGLAADLQDPSVDIDVRVKEVRADVEEGLMLALDEVNRIGRDGVRRTGLILAQGLRSVKDEAPFYGTLDLPDWERRSSRVFRERVEALEALSKDLTELRDSAGGEYALLAMELELVGLEARAKDLLGGHRARLEGEVQRRVVQQGDRVAESFLEALQHLRSEMASAKSGRELAMAVRQITEVAEKTAGEAARIARELREELLDQEKIAPLIEALGAAAAALTMRYKVIAGRLMHGEWKLPPAVPPVEVPFRETVLDAIDTRVAPRLLKATRAMADEIQPLVTAMREAERLLAFNTELATSELEFLGDDPIPAETLRLVEEMVVGQLDRSEGTLEAFLDEARGWPQRLGEDLHQAALGTLTELRGQLVDGEITRAKLDEIRRSANRRRLALRAIRLPELLRDVRTQARRAVVLLIGETRLELWRRFLGLPASRDDLVVAPEVFAPPAPRVKLPLVYERLFAADTMEASDVLTGREEQIRRAREFLAPAKETRGQGRRRAVAVVGLDGVGKASVTSAIIRGGRWKSVKRFSLDRPFTVADVNGLLEEARSASLVVVDGLFWMVAAKPGGFEPLRRFVDGVLADGDQRSWLVQAEDVFWRYASAVAPIADAFPEVVELKPLTIDELTAAVMERHRLSGYGHAFDRLEGESWLEAWLARSASKFRRPYEQYFKELHAATGGLVRDALRLWLTSIRGIEADDIVHVGHVPSSGYTAVSRLPTDQLMLLFQVARQGWMNDAVLAHLFRTDRRTARAQLARLHHLGLLESGDGLIFRVSLHLRGALARVIRERGWS